MGCRRFLEPKHLGSLIREYDVCALDEICIDAGDGIWTQELPPARHHALVILHLI
jgi:hypothetical protein